MPGPGYKSKKWKKKYGVRPPSVMTGNGGSRPLTPAEQRAPSVPAYGSVPAPSSSSGSRSSSRSVPTSRGDYGRSGLPSVPMPDVALMPNSTTGLSPEAESRAHKAFKSDAGPKHFAEAVLNIASVVPAVRGAQLAVKAPELVRLARAVSQTEKAVSEAKKVSSAAKGAVKAVKRSPRLVRRTPGSRKVESARRVSRAKSVAGRAVRHPVTRTVAKRAGVGAAAGSAVGAGAVWYSSKMHPYQRIRVKPPEGDQWSPKEWRESNRQVSRLERRARDLRGLKGNPVRILDENGNPRLMSLDGRLVRDPKAKKPDLAAALRGLEKSVAKVDPSGLVKTAKRAGRIVERAERDSPVKRLDRAWMGGAKRSALTDAASAAIELGGRRNLTRDRRHVRSLGRGRGRVRFVGTPTVGGVTRAVLHDTLRSKDKAQIRGTKSGRFTVPETRKAIRNARVAGAALAKARSLASVPGVPGEMARTLRKMGYSKFAIAGIIGNAMAESSMNPEAVEPGTDNGGLLGFTAGEKSMASLRAFAAERGLDPSRPATQMRFADQTVSPELKARLNAASSPEEAASIFMTEWERPGIPREEVRTSAARDALGAASVTPVPKRLVRNYRKAVAEGAKLGLNLSGKPSPGKSQLGKPSPKVVSRMTAAVAAANQLEKMQINYVLGGGHVPGMITNPGAGLDCSSSISYIMQKMGLLDTTLVSGSFGSVTKPGPGAITIFYNDTHVFARLGNKYFGTSSSNPGGGPGWIDASVAEPEANSGKYNVGHIPGLGRNVALQLGIKGGGATSFPGMSFSSDGSTASINSGAGAQVGSPGFSDRPIASDGAYNGSIDSGGLTDFYSLIMNAGAGEPGDTGVLDEFIGDRAKPRRRR